MRLRSLIILLLFVFVSLPILAAEKEEAVKPWWVEAQIVSGKNPSKVIGWYERDLEDSSLGFFASAAKTSDGYREFYAGPTLKPLSWLKVGVGIGRETVSNEVSGTRRSFFFGASGEKFSSFGIVENGVSGRWDKVKATYALTERVSIGAMHETFLGRGPLIEYNFEGATKVQLWVALLRDTSSTTSVLGFNIAF